MKKNKKLLLFGGLGLLLVVVGLLFFSGVLQSSIGVRSSESVCLDSVRGFCTNVPSYKCTGCSQVSGGWSADCALSSSSVASDGFHTACSGLTSTCSDGSSRVSHDSYKCYNLVGNIYYFDSCGTMEDMKTPACSNGCVVGATSCSGVPVECSANSFVRTCTSAVTYTWCNNGRIVNARCGDGLGCNDGLCVAPPSVCVPGSVMGCSKDLGYGDNEGVVTCNSAGSGYDTRICDVRFVCQNGACVNKPECVSNSDCLDVSKPYCFNNVCVTMVGDKCAGKVCSNTCNDGGNYLSGGSCNSLTGECVYATVDVGASVCKPNSWLITNLKYIIIGLLVVVLLVVALYKPKIKRK